jgi:hypothetical protein
VGGVLALFLLALAPGLAAPRDADAGPPAFSRSRWIAGLAARGVRFSSGVLPAGRRELAALLAAMEEEEEGVAGAPAEAGTPGKAAGANAGGANRTVRVSGDVLTADGSASEPETQAEPFLAIDPARETRLLAGYQEGRFSDGGARALTYAVSEDGGRRWREGLVAGLTTSTGGPYERASDPWVAFGPDGRAYFVGLAFDETTPRNGILLSASADGGRTWGDPATVHLGGNEFDDKEAVVVDTRDDSPFRGRVYVAWDSVDNLGLQTLRVAWSDDGGLTFGPSVAILTAPGAVGAIPMVGPGGVLHVVFLHTPPPQGGFIVSRIATVRSEDGGATWSPLVVVAESFAVGVPFLRTGGLPAAAVDPVSGQLARTASSSAITRGSPPAGRSSTPSGSPPSSARGGTPPCGSPTHSPACSSRSRRLRGASIGIQKGDEMDQRCHPERSEGSGRGSFDARAPAPPPDPSLSLGMTGFEGCGLPGCLA